MNTLASKIKSFDLWLFETFGEDHLSIDENTTALVRFTYDSAVCETLKYVMDCTKCTDDVNKENLS